MFMAWVRTGYRPQRPAATRAAAASRVEDNRRLSLDNGVEFLWDDSPVQRLLGVVEDVTRGGKRLDAQGRGFESFATVEGQRLRRALISAYGVDAGCDACAEALAWAWENWSRVAEMANPVGYLFRVGQSSARRQRRWHRPITLPVEIRASDLGEMDARLDEALVALSSRQRLVAVLVHGYGYSYAEVAQVTTSSVASVRNDLHRAMKRLRRKLEAQ